MPQKTVDTLSLRHICIPCIALLMLACNLPFAIPGFASPNPEGSADFTSDMSLPVLTARRRKSPPR